MPTIAVNLEPFALIRQGDTGLLAGNEAEWVAGLRRLIEAPAERHRMGAAAQADVQRYHTTAARAAEFHAMIRTIKNRAWITDN